VNLKERGRKQRKMKRRKKTKEERAGRIAQWYSAWLLAR
jgi:hypothetical protein